MSEHIKEQEEKVEELYKEIDEIDNQIDEVIQKNMDDFERRYKLSDLRLQVKLRKGTIKLIKELIEGNKKYLASK